MSFLIQELADLTDLNGLKLPIKARWLAAISGHEELAEAAEFARQQALPVVVIGEGSNLVPVRDVDAVVLLMQMRGRTATDNRVKVSAGENWHQLVSQLVSERRYGLENLALIPGTAGAAPIQNIGAYGVELADRLLSLDAFNIQTGEVVSFSGAECQFGYRNSRFKREPDWVITSLELAVSNADEPVLTYPGISEWIDQEEMEPGCEAAFDAVVSIRTAKLPDPRLLPNVGSFFKNPVVSESMLTELDQADMPKYQQPGGQIKLSAAWLIDQTGLKGQRIGGICVSDQHALVLINLGNGTGDDVLELTQLIRDRVKDRFGITLDVEPSVIPHVS